MIVYIDIVILENFIVNLFLLNITSQTLKIEVQMKRLITAAFIGSLYTLTMLYKDLYVFTKMPFKIIAALIIISIALLKKNNFVFIVKGAILFILYSMVLAGMCVFLQFKDYGAIDEIGIIYNFSYKKLLLSIMVLYIFLYRIVIYIKERRAINNLVFNVKICMNNSEKLLKGFLDTGNDLREPATSLPVIIVSKNSLSDLDLGKYDKFYIPYSSVGKSKGVLVGFKPERLQIWDKEKFKDVKAIIAINNESLSLADDYDALLSRAIFD